VEVRCERDRQVMRVLKAARDWEAACHGHASSHVSKAHNFRPSRLDLSSAGF
jgi:hypothetical protein